MNKSSENACTKALALSNKIATLLYGNKCFVRWLQSHIVFTHHSFHSKQNMKLELGS